MTNATFDVTINDDHILEDDEDFTLTIDPSDDVVVVDDMGSTTVTINNDDGKCIKWIMECTCSICMIPSQYVYQFKCTECMVISNF